LSAYVDFAVLLGPSQDHVHENYGTLPNTSQVNFQAVLITAI
jgi:hypothetical protein